MIQSNVYRSSVDNKRDRGGGGTVKMLPRSVSMPQDDDNNNNTTSAGGGGGGSANYYYSGQRITRSNLVDQLREYQIRSKHDWASMSFFSSTSNLSSSSRVDVVVFVIWELVILAFFVFSAVSLYFRHMKLGFGLATVTLLLLVSMKVTKRIKLAQKKKRRMLLPLSM
ncbi:uncharacterized protein LOC143535266 [Bidens hawaiensis]|uniref:uncharacterized protein LOC143535266 n=1 Tax=Bidens hawaiensis TaxID=980011 RepID=UPI00404A9301